MPTRLGDSREDPALVDRYRRHGLRKSTIAGLSGFPRRKVSTSRARRHGGVNADGL